MSCRNFAALCALTAVLSSPPAFAINKCTGPDGTVTFQDAGCSSSAKKSETVKIWANDSRSGGRTSSRNVQPNFDLVTPPAAAPLMNLYRRWADAEKLALATGRIALAKPVADLQALQREAESTQVVACMDDAKKSLIKLISKNVEVMINFMGKEELSGMVYQFIDRAAMIKKFEQEMASAKCV